MLKCATLKSTELGKHALHGATRCNEETTQNEDVYVNRRLISCWLLQEGKRRGVKAPNETGNITETTLPLSQIQLECARAKIKKMKGVQILP